MCERRAHARYSRSGLRPTPVKQRNRQGRAARSCFQAPAVPPRLQHTGSPETEGWADPDSGPRPERQSVRGHASPTSAAPQEPLGSRWTARSRR